MQVALTEVLSLWHDHKEAGGEEFLHYAQN